MQPLASDFNIPTRKVLPNNKQRPARFEKTSLEHLCFVAEIPVRVTGGPQFSVWLYRGDEHFVAEEGLYVGVPSDWTFDRVGALRVIEILAFGFHDYAARECVCGFWYFKARARRGRPTTTGRARSAKDRMKKSRLRKRTSLST